MNVKYVGAARDYSGYGEAARHDIMALLTSGVNVTSKIPRFTGEIADFGWLIEQINKTEGKEISYDIVILHTTPNVYPQFMEKGKYHIARVFWETDKLPKDFADCVKLCNEVWTGSEFNAQAIRNAGIDKPIYIIPEAITTDLDTSLIKPYTVAHKDDYKFYSIFEWTQRKNPDALLEAFWREFEDTEGVSLTIKTYLDNFDREKKMEIDEYIWMNKAKLGLKRYAPVYLYRNIMDRDQVYRFHQTFDCFVSAHRGEGWGIPQMEALILNKPVISTNCGGIHEFLVDKEDALLVPYTLVPLLSNNRNTQWYTGDQKWAEVDINELRQDLRFVYNNKEKAKTIGIQGGKTARKKFSFQSVGFQMAERLKQINATQF